MISSSGSKVSISSVLMVTREYEGLAGAGGVKDVSRQLAETLVKESGVKVSVVLPLYGFMDPLKLGFEKFALKGNSDKVNMATFLVEMNYPKEERLEKITFYHKDINGVAVYLIDARRYQEKQGVYTYTALEEKNMGWQREGAGHYDYFAMNILLQKSALELMILQDEHPQIIHCQDGHAAILPAMIRNCSGYRHYFRHSGLLVTIHNAGKGYHQEITDLDFAHAVTGLPVKEIDSSLLDGDFNPFISASRYAVLNTVSENYAWELQETKADKRTGWLGHRLKKRGVSLQGVTNGINPEEFDPANPFKLGLAEAFSPSAGDLKGKRTCKQSMMQSLMQSLPKDEQLENVEVFGSLADNPKQPLLTFIGRLTTQKGVDKLEEAIGSLLKSDTDFSFLALGSGSPELEKSLKALAADEKYEGRVCFLKGYDPKLALKVYAAGDFFLIPSLYEPCGLTDYIAQLLGNLPIVHGVGGLVKVLHGKTGFSYPEHSSSALLATIKEALALYRSSPALLAAMQKNSVEQINNHHTWAKVMEKYFSLYEQSLEMADQSPVLVSEIGNDAD